MTRENLKSNHSFSFARWLKREREETSLLLRNIPATVVSLFVVSVIAMNLLANKTLIQTDWLNCPLSSRQIKKQKF